MRKKISRLLGIITLLIFVTACNLENKPTITGIPTVIKINIGDGGLLTSRPCGPPCFLGIQPDVTNYNEVISILSNNHDMNYCKEYNNENDGGGRGIKCADSFVISFDPDRKLVTGLGYNPTSNITVKNVIDKFGNPENIIVVTGGYSKTVSNMRIFYAKYKMSILLDEQDGDSYTIRPNSKVQTITYDGEKSYQALTKMIQKWSGYGKYIMQ